MKEQFIEDTNHELRTPIMSWYGNTEILSLQDENLPPDRRRHLIERALRSGKQVLRLLDSILDATVVASQAPHLTPSLFYLAPVIKETLESFDSQFVGLRTENIVRRDIRITLPGDLQVWADEIRVRQVLTNLISNALKYSPPGTPVEISGKQMVISSRKSQENKMVVVQVRDHGLGIPPSEAPKLFQRFVRLERDITGSVRGTGVGLYTCRILVEAMKGKIWIESSGIPNEGTEICFSLPSES
jgi:signal transduction histidine kinase